MSEKYIVHVDMDAFFAAIEQRDEPALKGKPVIVGAEPRCGRGRGVVSACSYEARKYGVKSAMPISEAWRRCPLGVFLPPDFKKYQAASKAIRSVFYDFTPDIEQISIDEAFLDITRSAHLFGGPVETCKKIKACVKAETDLACSVGLAPTKFAAKIASDLKKPDGLVVVKASELNVFLRPLDISRVWGLGPKTAAVLRAKGIDTIGELANCGFRELSFLGRSGAELLALASGIDAREVKEDGRIKSVSNEITFETDTADDAVVKESLLALCDKVSSRLRARALKGRTITLKIRLEGFITCTRTVTLAFATNFTEVINEHVMELHAAFKKGNKKIRLLGVKVSTLMPADFKESLFENKNDTRLENAHKAIETIREKYGRGAIYRAGGRKEI